MSENNSGGLTLRKVLVDRSNYVIAIPSTLLTGLKIATHCVLFSKQTLSLDSEKQGLNPLKIIILHFVIRLKVMFNSPFEAVFGHHHFRREL